MVLQAAVALVPPLSLTEKDLIMNVRLLSSVLGPIGIGGALRRGAALLVLLLAALTACDRSKLDSLTVAAQTTTVPMGTTTQLSATGLFANGKSGDITSLVTWSSAQPAIAGVSARGVADGKAQGKATITATYDGLTATVQLTVGAADLVSVEVVPPLAVLPDGVSQPFTAKATFTDGTSKDITSDATWAVEGDVAVLTRDPVGATSVAPGRGKLTITYQKKTASAVLVITDAELTSLALQPEKPSLAKGTTIPVRVIGTYSDGTSRDVTSLAGWTSQDAATIAIVLGAATHQLWDGFTHAWLWPASALYPDSTLTLSDHPILLARIFQHLSSALGLAIVLVYLARTAPPPDPTPPPDTRRAAARRLLTLLALPLAGCLVAALLQFREPDPLLTRALWNAAWSAAAWTTALLGSVCLLARLRPRADT